MANHNPKPKPQKERDAQIVALYGSGTPVRELVERFKISKQRVYVILNREFFKEHSECTTDGSR